MSQRSPKPSHGVAVAVLSVLSVLMVIATVFVIFRCVALVNQPVASTPATTPSVAAPTVAATTPATQETEPPTTAAPAPQVVSTATVGAQGDLLMHIGVLNSCKKNDGTYDFSSIFRYMGDYVGACDYAAINLETTLGGSKYPIQGNPDFNCPDSIVEAVKATGYQMLLTANNHCSDTHTDGILRTVETIREQGVTALGTQLSDQEENYAIVDVNGIQIGMACYTYATRATSDGRPSLNDREYVKQVGIVNYFRENDLETFYSQVEDLLAQMKEKGAEATMIYLHWGTENQITENETQRAMAQKLCDLGVDVIVGGHPHVVQPVALLESTVDARHKTVCIYSLGNAVSNQRKSFMDLKTGHTEDGVLFTVGFEKYDDGSVYLSSVDVLPTWVNRSEVHGHREYNILPLDDSRREEWKELFSLTDSLLKDAQDSYERTMDIVGAGLEQCQTWLAQENQSRNAVA